MEQNQSPVTTESKKSFFEKYQLFIAIVICGILIGGGIVIAKLLPGNNGSTSSDQTPTQASVRSDMIDVAKKIGISKSKFATCLDNGTNKQKIADAVTLAGKSGVQGTPTFFVLKRTYDAKGAVVSEKQFEILGARDYDTFAKSLADGKAPADQPAQPTGDKIVLSDTDHWTNADPKTAQTILVEYSDIDCPFCKRAKPVVDQLLKDHPEYAFVYRHSPIVSLHPWAEYKAQASECAYDNGGTDAAAKNTAFWNFLNIVAK